MRQLFFCMESDDEKRPREEETAAEEPTPFNDVRADVSAERLLQDARLDARRIRGVHFADPLREGR